MERQQEYRNIEHKEKVKVRKYSIIICLLAIIIFIASIIGSVYDILFTFPLVFWLIIFVLGLPGICTNSSCMCYLLIILQVI